MANFSSKNFLGSLETPWSTKIPSSGIPSSGSPASASFALNDEITVHEVVGSGAKFQSSRIDSFGKNQAYSMIKEGCIIRGAFECEGDLVLGGFVEGDLLVHGELTILESGDVKANIRAFSVIVFGRVVGDIRASELIKLHSNAQVRGNIKTKRLLIQDGVVFDGRCEMETREMETRDMETREMETQEMETGEMGNVELEKAEGRSLKGY